MQFRGFLLRGRVGAAAGGLVRVAVAKHAAKFASASAGLRRAVCVPVAAMRVGWLRGFEDAPLGLVLLSGDAPGVDAQQHIDPVACPLGDLGRSGPGVEPGGHGRVPQIVRSAGQPACAGSA